MKISQSVFLKDYISVDDHGQRSFGGSQTWFPLTEGKNLKNLHMGACGLIGASDFCLFFARKNRQFSRSMPEAIEKDAEDAIPKSEYLDMVLRSSRLSYPIFPKVGSFSFEFSHFVNNYLRSIGSDDRIHYLLPNTKNTRHELIRKQLEAGYPVPLIIGQRLLNPLSKRGVHFYQFKDNVPIIIHGNVHRHFVNITGIYISEDVRMPLFYEISSWGRKYYIKAADLDDYIGTISAPWISSVFILNSVREKTEET